MKASGAKIYTFCKDSAQVAGFRKVQLPRYHPCSAPAYANALKASDKAGRITPPHVPGLLRPRIAAQHGWAGRLGDQYSQPAACLLAPPADSLRGISRRLLPVTVFPDILTLYRTDRDLSSLNFQQFMPMEWPPAASWPLRTLPPLKGWTNFSERSRNFPVRGR